MTKYMLGVDIQNSEICNFINFTFITAFVSLLSRELNFVPNYALKFNHVR